MHNLTVKIPATKSGSYPISIASGKLAGLWQQLEGKFIGKAKFIVTDENIVKAGHLQKLAGGRDLAKFVIKPPGEHSKHIGTVISIVEAMEKAQLGRDTAIVALGGGTVGDIAGFAAAIFKRGIQVVHIPTTTISQADSAIGGKTGVDSTMSKNAFGAFWQPAAVYIDPETLTTMGAREFSAGLAESVKHALIADEKYFLFLEKNMDAILERQLDALEKVAYYNCRIKASVVQVDPTEKNQRRMLNYGHTIGHAVEQASGFNLLHGESVAIGIIAAGLIEEQMGLGDSESRKRVREILERLGVGLRIPENINKNMLLDIIARDKKAVNKWPRFVLIEKIGSVLCRDGQYAVEVERKIVERTLDELLQ